MHHRKIMAIAFAGTVAIVGSVSCTRAEPQGAGAEATAAAVDVSGVGYPSPLPEPENTAFHTDFRNAVVDFSRLDARNYRARLLRLYATLPELTDFQLLARISILLDYGKAHAVDGLEPLLLAYSDTLALRSVTGPRNDLRRTLENARLTFVMTDPALALMVVPLGRASTAVVMDVRADVARVMLSAQLANPGAQTLDTLFGLRSVQQANCLLPPLDSSSAADLLAADRRRAALCQSAAGGMGGSGTALDSATSLGLSACINGAVDIVGSAQSQLASQFASANDCADQLDSSAHLRGPDAFNGAAAGFTVLARLLGAEFGAAAAKDLHDAVRAGGAVALHAIEKYTDQLMAERADRIKGQTQAAKDYYAAIGALGADEANMDLEARALEDAEANLATREADVAHAQAAVDDARDQLVALQNALGGNMTDNQRSALNARIDTAKGELTDKQHLRDGDVAERNKARERVETANQGLKAAEEKFDVDADAAQSAHAVYTQQGGQGALNGGGAGAGGGGVGGTPGPELPDACTGIAKPTGPMQPGPGLTGTGIVGALGAWSRQHLVANPNPEATADATTALALPLCGSDLATLRPAARACQLTTCPDATSPCGCVSAATLSAQLAAADTLAAKASARACQDLRHCAQGSTAVGSGVMCDCAPTDAGSGVPRPTPLTPAPNGPLLDSLFLRMNPSPVVESNPLKFFVRQAFLRY